MYVCMNVRYICRRKCVSGYEWIYEKLSARERNKGTGNRKAPVASCLMDSLLYYLVFRDVGCKLRGRKLKYFKLQVLSM